MLSILKRMGYGAVSFFTNGGWVSILKFVAYVASWMVGWFTAGALLETYTAIDGCMHISTLWIPVLSAVTSWYIYTKYAL